MLGARALRVFGGARVSTGARLGRTGFCNFSRTGLARPTGFNTSLATPTDVLYYSSAHAFLTRVWLGIQVFRYSFNHWFQHGFGKCARVFDTARLGARIFDPGMFRALVSTRVWLGSPRFCYFSSTGLARAYGFLVLWFTNSAHLNYEIAKKFPDSSLSGTDGNLF